MTKFKVCGELETGGEFFILFVNSSATPVCQFSTYTV